MTATAPGGRGRLVVDRTHLSRRSSGIERITRDLFSDQALAPLPVSGIEAPGSRLAIVANQRLRIPAAAFADPRSVWAFPGYPPSPLMGALRERVVFYVHDLFLITRVQDLNRSARLYMAGAFRRALRRLRYFLVNSEATGRELMPHVGSDALVLPYRPRVANAFGVAARSQGDSSADRPLVLGAIGTVEPRKNYPAAAALRAALEARLGRKVELHIVGRPGWGEDARILAADPGVRLHGFLDEEAARAVIERFDIYVCTSHDEGLGLPLLEAQYAGIPIVAPDQPVFREVLGESGLFIRPGDLAGAAERVAAYLDQPDWRARARDVGSANLDRWNAQAARDHARVLDFFGDLTRRVGG